MEVNTLSVGGSENILNGSEHIVNGSEHIVNGSEHIFSGSEHIVTGCGECRGICADMYENIKEDNEYEEDTYVVVLSRIIPRSCISH